MKIDLPCGDCGAEMVLRQGSYGIFYGCVRYPDCRGTHAAHQKNAEPMGIPADKETREWRQKTHGIFEPYVEEWFPTRREGYTFMAKVMNLSEKEAHIGRFTIAQCKKLIRIVENNQGKDLS